MVKAVIFDLYETLITEWVSDKYHSGKCAADLGVDYKLFREVWESLHPPMDTGACSYEQALIRICRAAGITPSPETLALCVARRIKGKAQCFAHPREDILQMLGALKAAGVRLCLCSNCSSDEVTALRESALYPYFDAVVLSYEAGVKKPDEAIYRVCTEKLGVSPSDCLYIGDGGSHELYGARAVGMKPARAMWFLIQYAQKFEPMPFDELNAPGDVIRLCGGSLPIA